MKPPMWLPDWDEAAFQTLVPEHLRAGLKGYFFQGILPGSFLRALLDNNLMDAVFHADPISMTALKSILCFLCSHAPARSFGSPAIVRQWSEEISQEVA